MSKQDIFIGREKELKMIDEMLFDPTGANHIWPILGEGGVGKTWLLREIYHRYQSDSSVFVIKIDYGEARSQSWPSLMMYIMEQLVPYTTKLQKMEYEQKLDELERLAKSNTSADKIKDKEEEIFSIVYWSATCCTKKKPKTARTHP